MWYCGVLRKGADIWQRKEQTAKVTSAKGKTVDGKVDTPLAMTPPPASESSKTCWARPKQKSKKS